VLGGGDQPALRGALADGMPIKGACVVAGINVTTLGEWREKRPEIEGRTKFSAYSRSKHITRFELEIAEPYFGCRNSPSNTIFCGLFCSRREREFRNPAQHTFVIVQAYFEVVDGLQSLRVPKANDPAPTVRPMSRKFVRGVR
jgi:hypothetical protein